MLFRSFCKKCCPQISLKAPEISGFRGVDTSCKKADERGLYLEIFPNGSKLWRVKYRVGTKEKRISLGAWPEISPSKARHLRDTIRAKLVDGKDPALERKRAKIAAKIGSGNTFEAIAQEYIEDKMVRQGLAEATLLKARWFLDLLKPAIGTMPINDGDGAACGDAGAVIAHHIATKDRGIAAADAARDDRLIA